MWLTEAYQIVNAFDKCIIITQFCVHSVCPNHAENEHFVSQPNLNWDGNVWRGSEWEGWERGCHGGVSELIAINRRPPHSERGGHRIGLPGANTPVCVCAPWSSCVEREEFISGLISTYLLHMYVQLNRCVVEILRAQTISCSPPTRRQEAEWLTYYVVNDLHEGLKTWFPTWSRSWND